MNPLTPHDVPHEFLTIQELSALKPTKRTAWLSYLPQVEKTPLEYLDQLLASTAIVNGYLATADYIAAIEVAALYPVTLVGPVAILHVPVLAVYGYYD